MRNNITHPGTLSLSQIVYWTDTVFLDVCREISLFFILFEVLNWVTDPIHKHKKKFTSFYSSVPSVPCSCSSTFLYYFEIS